MNENYSRHFAEPPDDLEIALAQTDQSILDDGFTARVMQSLPPCRRLSALRGALLIIAWLAGAVIVATHFGTLRQLSASLLQQAQLGSFLALLALAPLALALGSLLWALVSAACEET